jgi:hypothetical protein
MSDFKPPKLPKGTPQSIRNAYKYAVVVVAFAIVLTAGLATIPKIRNGFVDGCRAVHLCRLPPPYEVSPIKEGGDKYAVFSFRNNTSTPVTIAGAHFTAAMSLRGGSNARPGIGVPIFAQALEGLTNVKSPLILGPKQAIILRLDERSARKDESDKERVKFLRTLAHNQDSASAGLFICYLYVDADDMDEDGTMLVDYGATACDLMASIIGEWSDYQVGKPLHQEEVPHQPRGR